MLQYSCLPLYGTVSFLHVEGEDLEQGDRFTQVAVCEQKIAESAKIAPMQINDVDELMCYCCLLLFAACCCGGKSSV